MTQAELIPLPFRTERILRPCPPFDTISPWEQKIYSRLLIQEELVDARVILEEVDRRWGRWKMLAASLVFEDLFWQRRRKPVPWLEELIRL